MNYDYCAIIIPPRCMSVFLEPTPNKSPDQKSKHDGLLRIFIFECIHQMFHASTKAEQHLTHCSTRKCLLLFFNMNILYKVLKGVFFKLKSSLKREHKFKL